MSSSDAPPTPAVLPAPDVVAELHSNYNKVLSTVAAVAATANKIESSWTEDGPTNNNTTATSPPAAVPRLVAVSKFHEASELLAVYGAGCRVYGENYVQEMCSKAPQLPDDIQWHFIGHLQSNKVKELLSAVPSLDAIETVDSEKLAKKIDEGVDKYRAGKRPLNVYIQVNTSGEESKSGVEPKDAAPLCALIHSSCPLLRVRGLMTIGMPDYTSRPENFTCLQQCRKEAAALMGLASEYDLELSMGMSGDYEAAIRMGSNNVRVGTAIFGQRHAPQK